MKLITKLLIVVATLGLCPGLYAQNLDPPSAKDDHVVNLNDESSGSSGTSAQSSSSYQRNYLFLDRSVECICVRNGSQAPSSSKTEALFRTG